MKPSEYSLDLTGNWRSDFPNKPPGIRVREPWIKRGERTVFRQTLRLPAGTYRLELRYDPLTDKKPGFALGGNLQRFDGLRVNGRLCRLHFIEEEFLGTDSCVARCAFTSSGDGAETTLELRLRNTRVMRTLLLSDQPFPAGSRYVALPPEAPESGEACLIGGIPFLTRRVTSEFTRAGFKWIRKMHDTGELVPWRGGMHLDCADTPVDTAYFLGMIHRFDIANGSWYNEKGDHGYSHFVGDRAGGIAIHWTDGETSEIPLIFGYNLWYSRPWDMLWHYCEYTHGVGGENFDDVLFKGKEEIGREIVRSSLKLSDGIRLMGSNSCNARYVFSVKLGGRKVRSIEVRGTADMHGYPIVSAVTLETAGMEQEPSALEKGRLAELPQDLSEMDAQIAAVDLPSIEQSTFASSVRELQRLLYTFPDELPVMEKPKSRTDISARNIISRGHPKPFIRLLIYIITVPKAQPTSRTPEPAAHRQLPAGPLPTIHWESGSGLNGRHGASFLPICSKFPVNTVCTPSSAVSKTGSAYTAASSRGSFRGWATYGRGEPASCCGRRWRSVMGNLPTLIRIGLIPHCLRKQPRPTGTGSPATRDAPLSAL